MANGDRIAPSLMQLLSLVVVEAPIDRSYWLTFDDGGGTVGE